MKTLNEMIEWLKTPNKLPVILVEIPGILPGNSTMYLSSSPFSSNYADPTLPNTFYSSIILGGVNFSESLNLTGGVSIGYGDIELDNTNGIRDNWLYDYIWVNKDIEILFGDSTWNRDDFRPIFKGIIVDIATRTNNSLNIILADKLQKLNNPITEDTLSNVNSNSSVIIPLSFGEVFNVTPISSSTIVNTLEYQVHNGPIEDIIEVRDNGVPVSITKNLTEGKFSLTQSPYGQITCSVQGYKNPTYFNDIANLIKIIVKNYGPTFNRLTDSDIDLTNFSNFNSLYVQPVGTYVSSKDNLLSVCNFLANSVGAQVVFSSTGLLRLIPIDLNYTGGTLYNVGPGDFEYNSISVTNKTTVKASTKLGYCKNYTVQKGTIAAGVPTNNLELFENEFIFENTVDSSVQSTYKLTSTPSDEPTALLVKSDAQTEVARRNALWKVPRFVVTFKGYGHLLPIELGDRVNLTDSRFGLQNTKQGLVVSISRDWISNRVTVGVLI